MLGIAEGKQCGAFIDSTGTLNPILGCGVCEFRKTPMVTHLTNAGVLRMGWPLNREYEPDL